MKVLLAALAMGTATLAPGAALAAVAPIAAPASDVEQLAALLLPDDALTQLVIKVFDAGIQNDAQMAPERKAIFASNPGLKQHVADAVRGDLAVIMKKELPALRAELSALLAKEMTAAEIGETLAFFSSATGQKMMAQIYQGIANAGATNEDQAKEAAMAALMASLTAEDYPALMAFGATAAAKKMPLVSPKISEVSKAWAARMVATNKPRLTSLVEKATADFLAKKK